LAGHDRHVRYGVTRARRENLRDTILYWLMVKPLRMPLTTVERYITNIVMMKPALSPAQAPCGRDTG
jgi:hypothetical protein